MKDRGVYETPGGTILYKAHQCLEMITIDKDTAHMKSKLAVDFADLVYNGKWFTPLREALTAFATDTQKYVTGTVKLKLYKDGRHEMLNERNKAEVYQDILDWLER